MLKRLNEFPKRVPTIILKNVLVTMIAENILIRTPIAKVIENPRTKEAPNCSPNQNKIKQVIKVEIFESRIEGQALLKPVSTALDRGRPFLSSSLKRSNIKIFASTAIPTERINAAIPESVKVTGQSLKTARVSAT